MKLPESVEDLDIYIKFFSRILLTILIVGSLFGLTSIVITIFAENLNDMSFCFNSSCLEFFFERIEFSLYFFYWAGVLVFNLVILFSVYLGVGNFLLVFYNSKITNQSAMISNNVNQFSCFSGTLDSLILKYPMISNSSVDYLKWYVSLYQSPMNGDFSIKDTYLKNINEIDAEVLKSNEEFVSSNKGKYNYKEHQFTVIGLFKNIGFDLVNAPRSHFNEIERDVVNLVNDLNSMFVGDDRVKKITVCEYK